MQLWLKNSTFDSIGILRENDAYGGINSIEILFYYKKINLNLTEMKWKESNTSVKVV